MQLTPGEQSRLSAAPSINPEAHDAYLKGRFFFNRPSDENLQKAIAQFEAVVKLSPTFAPAYSGLSDAYTWAAYNEGFIRAVDAKPLAKERRGTGGAARQHVGGGAHLAGRLQGMVRIRLGRERTGTPSGDRPQSQLCLRARPAQPDAGDSSGASTRRLPKAQRAHRARSALAVNPERSGLDVDVRTARRRQPWSFRGKRRNSIRLSSSPLHWKGCWRCRPATSATAIAKFEQSRTLAAPPFTTAYLAYAYGMSGDRARAMATLARTQEDVGRR